MERTMDYTLPATVSVAPARNLSGGYGPLSVVGNIVSKNANIWRYCR